MENNQSLSNSAFWQDLYNKMNNDPTWVRINGKSFIFTSSGDIPPDGWDKSRYPNLIGYAKLKDKGIIHSKNVWFQGEIPEEFKELMPDNAEWASKEEFDNAEIVGYLGCGLAFADRVEF